MTLRLRVLRGTRQRRACCALLALSAGFGLVSGAASAAEDDARLWLTALTSYQLPADFSATLFVQARVADDISEFERTLINPSLGKNLGGGLSAALGYDIHLLEFPREITEHRVWQQLGYRHAFGPVAVQHRLRLEQRFIEDINGSAVRLRYMLEGVLPIPQRQWSLVSWNELFFDLNSRPRGPQSGFGETRFFMGFETPAIPTLKIQAGYMLQYVERPGADAANHVVFMSFRFAP